MNIPPPELMTTNIMLEMNCLFRLIQTTGENSHLTGTIKDVKRDKYVLIVAWIFILTLLLVGKKQGLFSVISLVVNAVLLSYALDIYLKHQALVCYGYAVSA